MRSGILFLFLSTCLLSSQNAEALSPYSPCPSCPKTSYRSNKWDYQPSAGYYCGYNCAPAPMPACCPMPNMEYNNGNYGCYQPSYAPAAPCQPACSPLPAACPTTPEQTSDYPTICYTPYRYYVPKYVCSVKTDCIPVYKKQKQCRMVPKVYEKQCCKYVPQYYTQRYCRYEPEYFCTDVLACVRKQNRLVWDCKYEPRYYYKKSVTCQNNSGCPTNGSGVSGGGAMSACPMNMKDMRGSSSN